jgi:tetratricopeptide (TPR) repeat protein
MVPERAIAAGIMLLVLFLVPGTPGSRADQSDPRLEGLFAALEGAPDLVVARGLEARIWEIWMEGPDPPSTALLEAGSEAMARRAWPTALERFDKLVADQPGFAEAWNKRATLYYLMGDYPRSVADIQRTLALEPRHFGALSGLGLIFMAVGNPESALKSFEAALAIHPYLPGARQHVEALRQQLRGEQL